MGNASVKGNTLTFVILSKLREGNHHSSLIILDSSFIIRNSWDTQSFIVHHSSFFIHHSSFIIHQHSSLSIDHCSFGRHHLSFIISEIDEESMRKLWKINQKWTKNQCKSNQNRSWTPLEPSWSCPGLQDPFKSEQLNFALTLERNGHSGEKWWFRSRVRAVQKVTSKIENRIYPKS